MAKVFTSYNTYCAFAGAVDTTNVQVALSGLPIEEYDFVWMPTDPTVELVGGDVVEKFRHWTTVNKVPSSEWNIVD